MENENIRANSRFGIGILSCFIFNEGTSRVEVSTKHYRDNDGDATIRVSIPNTRKRYFLSSKRINHYCEQDFGSDRVLSYDNIDEHGYRKTAGTTVVVQFPLNAFQSEGISSVKAVLDRYVKFPDVTVEYYGVNEHYIYPTEDDLNRAIDGLGEFNEFGFSKTFDVSLSDESYEKLMDRYQEITWIEKPNVRIRFFSLNKLPPLRDHPYISGLFMVWNENELKIEDDNLHKYGIIKAGLFARLEGNSIIFSFSATGFETEILTRMNIIRHDLVVRSYMIDDPFDKEVCLAYAEGLVYSEDWINTISKKYGISEKEVLKSAKDFSLPEIEGFDRYKIFTKYDTPYNLKEKVNIPNYKDVISEAFTARYGNEQSITSLAAYNGIVSESVHNHYNHYRSLRYHTQADILILKDMYRPEVNISRTNIRKLPLEAQCVLHMATSCMKKYHGFTEIQPYGGDILEYAHKNICRILDANPEIEDAVYVPTSKGYLRWMEINTDETVFFDTSLERNGSDFLIFCIAVLRRHYALLLNTNFIYLPTVQICKRTRPDNISKDLLPNLFIETNDENSFFSSGTYDCLPAYNADHRFAKWILRHQNELRKKASDQLEAIYRYLSAGYDAIDKVFDEKRIRYINQTLESISHNFDIEVPNDVYLKRSDFASLKWTDNGGLIDR